MSSTLKLSRINLGGRIQKQLLAAGLVAIGAFSATAIARANDAENLAAASHWGRYFTMAPYQSRPIDVTIATNKKTGEKMNVVKLDNGHLMVLVPAEKYLAIMSETPDQDMIPMK